MSEVKVNKISPRTTCGTTTLGDSGDTFNIPAGVTISNNGTATGFGGTGVVSWDTTPKTVDFTAVTGTGYFVDTATTGAVQVTLPASPTAGDVVGVSDYAKNFNTANCTLLRNGSNIGGTAFNSTISTDGVAVTLVYVDATKGWIVTDSGNQSDAPTVLYVTATGGCITTCGDYRIHTFNSPGTFCVSVAGNPAGSDTVEYLVVAGGGSGPAKGLGDAGGGGGAGGLRFASPSLAPLTFPGKPLNGPSALSISVQGYPITVGGGGAGHPAPPATCAPNGNGANGVDSVFASITSTGGGRGGYNNPRCAGTGFAGGSGGGGMSGTGGCTVAGGNGNDPPTAPTQGIPGGPFQYASPNRQGGGGGGAMCSGATGACSSAKAGGDGAGLPTGFGANGVPCGSFRYYAGGGAGGSGAVTPASGGKGGGGAGAEPGGNGTDNTGGGGGGGSGYPGAVAGGSGGSGIVVIRYKYQN